MLSNTYWHRSIVSEHCVLCLSFLKGCKIHLKDAQLNNYVDVTHPFCHETEFLWFPQGIAGLKISPHPIKLYRFQIANGTYFVLFRQASWLWIWVHWFASSIHLTLYCVNNASRDLDLHQPGLLWWLSQLLLSQLLAHLIDILLHWDRFKFTITDFKNGRFSQVTFSDLHFRQIYQFCYELVNLLSMHSLSRCTVFNTVQRMEAR